jgi:hypothetical protein
MNRSSAEAMQAQQAANRSLAPEEILCLGCGFCCDGTLFASVTLESQEGQQAVACKASGLKVGMGSAPLMPQPCCHHQSGHCQVYAQRPTRCHTFRCKLLSELIAQDISLGDAQTKVAETRELRDDVKHGLNRVLPSTRGLPLVGALKGFRKQAKSLQGASLARFLGEKRHLVALKKRLEERLNQDFYPVT